MTHVSRRAVLGSLAAGAAAVALAPPAEAARAGQGRSHPGIHPLETVTLRTFDAAWTTEWELTVPVVLQLSGFAAATDLLQATVTYDPRLLDPTGDVVLTAAGSVWTDSPEPPLALADGSAQIAFVVGRPPGRPRTRPSTVVALPLRPRSLYPGENVGPPVPFTVTLARSGASERAVHRATRTAVSTAVRPWSAHVEAGWARAEVLQSGKASTYLHPVSVTVVGQGPHPVPRGAELTIEVDAALVASTAVTAARLDGAALDVGDARSVTTDDRTALRTTWRLPVDVAAGSTLELALRTDLLPGTEEVRAIRFATVALAGTGAPDERLRASGSLVATSLTPSGNPETDGVAVGSV